MGTLPACECYERPAAVNRKLVSGLRPCRWSHCIIHILKDEKVVCRKIGFCAGILDFEYQSYKNTGLCIRKLECARKLEYKAGVCKKAGVQRLECARKLEYKGWSVLESWSTRLECARKLEYKAGVC